MMPKSTKSQIRDTRVRIQAKRATRAPAKEPMMPAPQAIRKARKAMPQATACSTITRVRPVEVPEAMDSKEVLATCATTRARS